MPPTAPRHEPRPRRAAPSATAKLRAAFLLITMVGAGCGATGPSATPAPSAGTTPAPPSALTPASSNPARTLEPDPDAASYGLRDPLAPARLPGRFHDIELAVHELHMTVAEGFVQAVWTVDGTVPGPVIRVREGDTVRVHLVNRPPKGSYPVQHPAVNAHSHAIAFEGSNGARKAQATPIRPGGEVTFQFTADRPGVWLYHGSAEPVLQSLANGLYGMLIVEPETGLGDVDRELFLVQGEWYLGGQYRPRPPLPSLEKAGAPDPTPDFIALNGVASQYLDHPIPVEAGERVRVFVLNAGPNLALSFWVEGAILERVVRDGIDIVLDEDGWGGEALDLSPGQGAIVELTLPAAGRYPIFTHAFSQTDRGASGLLEAADPDP